MNNIIDRIQQLASDGYGVFVPTYQSLHSRCPAIRTADPDRCVEEAYRRRLGISGGMNVYLAGADSVVCWPGVAAALRPATGLDQPQKLPDSYQIATRLPLLRVASPWARKTAPIHSRRNSDNIIDLDEVPPGASIEIARASVFPVRQRNPKHAWLCSDEQHRVITTDDGNEFLGAKTAEGLKSRLASLGFTPLLRR